MELARRSAEKGLLAHVWCPKFNPQNLHKDPGVGAFLSSHESLAGDNCNQGFARD